MDINKQPGIKVEAIILAESFFKRQPVIPDKINNIINFNVKNTVTPDNKRLFTEVETLLNTNDDPIHGKFVFIGVFSTEEDTNMDLLEFAQSSAPAIIFPYIREEIHSRYLKSGLPNLGVIPPVNIMALTKSANKKN
jgi:preprotein translocase subunit SecB